MCRTITDQRDYDVLTSDRFVVREEYCSAAEQAEHTLLWVVDFHLFEGVLKLYFIVARVLY